MLITFGNNSHLNKWLTGDFNTLHESITGDITMTA